MNRLFEKSEINGMVLTNRFIRSATFAGMATDEEGRCTSRLIDLMAGLAEGGVGLIITGHAMYTGRESTSLGRWVSTGMNSSRISRP